jgi:hypothetical protein
MHPGMKLTGVEDDLAFAFARLLNHIHYFDGHNSSSVIVPVKL